MQHLLKITKKSLKEIPQLTIQMSRVKEPKNFLQDGRNENLQRKINLCKNSNGSRVKSNY